jgi:hypothetical protein
MNLFLYLRANAIEFLKNRQYISLLFLFAISIVLAHSIVPHYHHAEPYLLGCQPATDKQDNPGKAPWHCHALNHVVFIEFQLLNKYKPVRSFHFEFIPRLIQRQLGNPESKPDIVLYPGFALQHIPLILPSRWRAPPVFA